MQIKTSVTGFPRIGKNRELKKILEHFWSKKIDTKVLFDKTNNLIVENWNIQKVAGIDLISINDFSLYDQMLDMAILIGAIPERFKTYDVFADRYFAMARGDKNCSALAMRKWFNTNYHYLVPELSINDDYTCDLTKISFELKEANKWGITNKKINLIGPVTFTLLSKIIDKTNNIDSIFNKVLKIYKEVLYQISMLGNDEIYIQLEEPWFVQDVNSEHLSMLSKSCKELVDSESRNNIILTTYFGHSCEANKIFADSKAWGVSLDFFHGPQNLESLPLLKNKKIVAGVINGRNVWKANLEKTVYLLNKISNVAGKENVIVSSSCSLLHIPFSLSNESDMDSKVKSRLSFACEKLDEIVLSSLLFRNEPLTIEQECSVLLNEQMQANCLTAVEKSDCFSEYEKKGYREPFEKRIKLQKEALQLPLLPTTTIGSFPQTDDLRKTRADFKNGVISRVEYEERLHRYIDKCIDFQVSAGLDVLVHGEPERNDMVEYFGENLNGVCITKNGWVQSYGSRCVKPPIIYDDISRPKPITLPWITYAQSRTDKPVKGMLTGPVTIVNWSFVREDISRGMVAKQIADALSSEIDELQKAGIKIIQVDEAAFKEGYPLRKSEQSVYEKWAVGSFVRMVSSAWPKTQIHTHMCYSYFDDIIGYSDLSVER